ncbi:MAG: peptide ABC transporter substrate-binding protein [Candidatus Moranbacteria bacterium]|nr:peptide ABC transporter substrate-binding protein [Candidatus Moranbacteria bacterium]
MSFLQIWNNIPKVLTAKEKIFFYLLIFIFSASLAGWAISFYYSKTSAVANYGGEYIEGMAGQPAHINPLLSMSNDADADISQLVYSGLLKYDNDGKLIPDLAESYDISDDKTTYTFHLKNGISWHDGVPFSADDVVFTINLLSDPSYKSPLRSRWQGVEASAPDSATVTINTHTPYSGFLQNATFGVLPKHLWETIQKDNFALTQLNLEPIGTGPYKYNSTQKDSKGNVISYKLVANPNYFLGKPYISKVDFNFYEDEASALSAFNRKEVMGIGGLSPQNIPEIKVMKSTQLNRLMTTRYFALFLNQTKSIPLSDDRVREALNLATDRQEIIGEVLGGNGQPVYSPILPGMIGYDQDLGKVDYDTAKANSVLDDAGWKMGDNGIRNKDGNDLKISLVTTDWEELMKTADVIKDQWEKIGAEVTVSSYSISDIQQNYIRPREYEALLFGQVLGSDPDPYSFWHSSQKKDPGLNLSMFGDSSTDQLIEAARTEFDTQKRADDYVQFQKKLIEELPAIFLYTPSYIYPMNKQVRGMEVSDLISPSKRFSNINNWYISTRRIWKK